MTIGSAGLACLVATGAEATPYTFTKVADGGSFPVLNNAGTVAYNGPDGVVAVASDGTVTTIIDSSSPLTPSSFLGINDNGAVAFTASFGPGNLSRGVFVGAGGPVTTIADSSGQMGTQAGFITPSINNAGTVTFTAPLDAGGFGVFVGASTVAETGASTGPLFSNFSSSTINNDGTVAFGAALGSLGGSALFTSSDGTLTTILSASGTPFQSLLGGGIINDDGTIAFSATLDAGGSGVFTIDDGTVTTVTDDSGAYSFFTSLNFNNNGAVAFIAGLDAGGTGIFTGSNPSTDVVVKVGDVLDGKTVTNLFMSGSGFNDAGQVAFVAQFDDSSIARFLADPETGGTGGSGGNEGINAFVAQLVTGSPASISQTVDTPTDPFELTFDYLFETTTGTLDVFLDGILLATLTAPDVLAVDFETASILIDDAGLLDQTGLTLEFLLDGPTGSSLLIDNIVFPGIENGDFESGDLAGWVGQSSGAGSTGAVRLADVTAVPEPGTLMLLAIGLAGLGAAARRPGAMGCS